VKLNNKNPIALLCAFAGLVIFVSGNVLAGNTNTLRVTANITGTCSFNTANVPAGNTTLDFGTLDQTSTSDAIATTATLQYWCTNGTAITAFDADLGQNSASCGGNRCLTNGSAYINYTLTFSDPVGNVGSGKTTPIDIDFDGTILNANYVDAPSGSYQDLVTLTISP
jgi:hypothetical protein